MTVVLALGFGAFLLATLFLVQHNLLRDAPARTAARARPNLVFFDIQPDQVAGVERDAPRRAGSRRAAPVPIVPMRIQSIKGRPVPDDRRATPPARSGGDGAGAAAAGRVRREYRSTYRDTLVASEKLLAGPGGTARRRAARRSISLEPTSREELGVGLGDEIVWDVQGVQIPTRVTSLREVDWARFEPNFFVVFAAGRARERAPDAGDPDPGRQRRRAGPLQRRIAERLPNVTALDLSQVQEALERLLDQVGAGDPVHGAVQPGHRHDRADRRGRHQPVPADPGGVAAQDPGRHPAPGPPDHGRRVRRARRCWRPLVAAGARRRGAGGRWPEWVFEGRVRDLPAAPLAALAAGVVALTVAVGLWNSRWRCSGDRRSRCCGPSDARLSASAVRCFGRAFRTIAQPTAQTARCSQSISRGKRALVAGVADDGGFGFAIAKALAEAGATVCVGTWPPALGIFQKLLERGKMDESLQLARRRASWSSSGSIRSTPPSTRWPTRRRRSARTSATRSAATSAIQGHGRRGCGRTSATRPLDIVVHSLANGPEVKKPLLETSRPGYLAAVSVSAYSNISLVRHLGAADAAGRLVPVAHLHGGRAGHPGLRRRDVVGQGGARGRHPDAGLRGGPPVRASGSTPSRRAPGPRAPPARSASSTR